MNIGKNVNTKTASAIIPISNELFNYIYGGSDTNNYFKLIRQYITLPLRNLIPNTRTNIIL